MKKILIYGDSITWGYNPLDGSRYEYSESWPGILQSSLGSEYFVITESIPGRTTCWDLPYMPYRSGKEYLPMLLESHVPLDLVIIMLGINDLICSLEKTADDSASGILSLIRIVLSSVPGFTIPKVLVISPPSLGDLSKFNDVFYEGKTEESKKLSEKYKAVAEMCQAEFLDSNQFIEPSEVDGVHPMKDQYPLLAEAVFKKIIEMKI